MVNIATLSLFSTLLGELPPVNQEEDCKPPSYTCSRVFSSSVCEYSSLEGYFNHALLLSEARRLFFATVCNHNCISIDAESATEDSNDDFIWLYSVNNPLKKKELQEVQAAFLKIWNAQVKDSRWVLQASQVKVTNGPDRVVGGFDTSRTDRWGRYETFEKTSHTVQIEVIPPERTCVRETS